LNSKQENEDINVDLVSPQDCVIGQKHLSDAIDKRLANIRYVKILFENEKGDLWIPKLPKSDIRYPGHLDVSGKRYVESNQRYEVALAVFIKKELGPNFNVESNLLGYCTPFNGKKTDVFAKVYTIRVNNVPNDYARFYPAAYWYQPQQIFNIIKRGKLATNDLKKLIPGLFSDNLSPLLMQDLLDFDPEENISELTGQYLSYCQPWDRKYIEDAREWAENKTDSKIAESVTAAREQLPRNCNLLPGKRKRASEGVYSFLSKETNEEIIERKGYLPIYYWGEYEKQEWYNTMADRHGVVFKKYCFHSKFTCSYKSFDVYKASGNVFKRIELADGTLFESGKESNIDKSGISIRNKRVRSDYSDDESTIIYIHDASVLPAKIFWYSQDVYPAKGFGTSGTSENCITEIYQDENHIRSRVVEPS